MIACIRFFYASFLFWGSLAAELPLMFIPGQEVRYEGRSSLQSEWNCEKHPLSLMAIHDIKGVLALDAFPQEEEAKYPISMRFQLDDMQYLMRDGQKLTIYNLDQPEQIVELREFLPWRGRQLPFLLCNV